jgi:hypothetical protein
MRASSIGTVQPKAGDSILNIIQIVATIWEFQVLCVFCFLLSPFLFFSFFMRGVYLIPGIMSIKVITKEVISHPESPYYSWLLRLYTLGKKSSRVLLNAGRKARLYINTICVSRH